MFICNLTRKIEDWATRVVLVFNIARSYYREVVHNEIVLADISCDDNILCIGGGICPFTAILFHQSTGARVTVIDNNSCCVDKAQQLIVKLGLDDAVRVVCEDGGSCGLDLASFSIVHFALQVSPMDCVFPYVESQVAPSTKLLVRQSKKHLRKLYNQLPSQLLSSCPVTTHKKARNIGSTLMYIKQAS